MIIDEKLQMSMIIDKFNDFRVLFHIVKHIWKWNFLRMSMIGDDMSMIWDEFLLMSMIGDAHEYDLGCLSMFSDVSLNPKV